MNKPLKSACRGFLLSFAMTTSVSTVCITSLLLGIAVGHANIEDYNPPTRFETITVHLASVRDFLNRYCPPHQTYELGVFDCKDFAKDLITDAHKAGLDAHLVVVTFKNNTAHALVGFPTVDAGMVYADATPSAGKQSGGAQFVLLEQEKLLWVKPALILSTNEAQNLQIATANGFATTNKVLKVQHFPQRELYHTNDMWLSRDRETI